MSSVFSSIQNGSSMLNKESKSNDGLPCLQQTMALTFFFSGEEETIIWNSEQNGF